MKLRDLHNEIVVVHHEAEVENGVGHNGVGQEYPEFQFEDIVVTVSRRRLWYMMRRRSMIMVRKIYKCLCSSRLYNMLLTVILIFIKVCF